MVQTQHFPLLHQPVEVGVEQVTTLLDKLAVLVVAVVDSALLPVEQETHHQHLHLKVTMVVMESVVKKLAVVAVGLEPAAQTEPQVEHLEMVVTEPHQL